MLIIDPLQVDCWSRADQHRSPFPPANTPRPRKCTSGGNWQNCWLLIPLSPPPQMTNCESGEDGQNCWHQLSIPSPRSTKCESGEDWQNCWHELSIPFSRIDKMWIWRGLTKLLIVDQQSQSTQCESREDWQNCWSSIINASPIDKMWTWRGLTKLLIIDCQSHPSNDWHKNCSRKMLTLSGIVPNLIFSNMLIVPLVLTQSTTYLCCSNQLCTISIHW